MHYARLLQLTSAALQAQILSYHALRLLGVAGCCYWHCLMNMAGYDSTPQPCRKSQLYSQPFTSIMTVFACLFTASNPRMWEDLDGTPVHLCPVCLRKLSLLGSAAGRFDAVQRYTQLQRLFTTQRLPTPVLWLEERVAGITQVGWRPKVWQL